MGRWGKSEVNDDLVLHLERFFPVPRRLVWRALTEPDELARWWGPRGFSVPSLDWQPGVGESYRIAMKPPEGEPFHLSGEFQEVAPPSRLMYTFRWSPPDPDDRETVVELSLREQADGTVLQVIQGGFATEVRLALHQAGWTESLERLEQSFRHRGAGPAAPPDLA
jgi:uncharacterized protein YndB with AHSA1/START domain